MHVIDISSDQIKCEERVRLLLWRKKRWYRKRLEIPTTTVSILVPEKNKCWFCSNLVKIGTRLKRIARYLESTGLIYHLVDGKEKEGIWYTKKEIGNKKKKETSNPVLNCCTALYMCMCILLQPDYSLQSFSQAPKTNCGLSDDETNFVHTILTDWLWLTTI